MTGNFSEKSIKVLAIESSGAVRQLLTDTLRSLGFEDVTGVPTLKDALSTMEVEPVGWVIAPILKDEEVNGLSILKLVTQYQSLKNTRVTLLLEEEELEEFAPTAFSLGMMGWIEKPFNKDTINKSLNAMMEKFEIAKWDSALLSATYLNDFLTMTNKHDDKVSLNKDFLGLYPGNTDLMIELAKASVGIGKPDNAKHVLNQIKIIAPEKSDEINKLIIEIIPGAEEGEEMGAAEGDTESMPKILDIGSCLVVDADESTGQEIEGILKELGCENAVCKTDGEEAWEWLKENEPELLIMEWRIPSLTGPLLIQRLREKHPTVPIIVQSALIANEDKPLLGEMGVATILPKPFTRADFVKFSIHTIQQDRIPTEMGSLERKIKIHLASNEIKQAEELKDKYTSLPELPEAKKVRMLAEFEYKKGNYEEAKNLAAEAMRRSSDTIQTLNLLGKTFIKLKDSAAALRCFEKAQNLSPLNLNRLCQIAEIHSENGNHEAAAEAAEAASEVDAGNEKVQQTNSMVAISSGDLESAKAIMNQLDSISDIISYLNNRAVALAQVGENEESKDLYQKTLDSIPDNKKELIPLVTYNLALGSIRASNYIECVEFLQKTIDYGNSKVLEKSKSLLKRVQEAIDNGTEIRLATSNSGQTQEQGKEGEAEEDKNDDKLVKPKAENLETLSAINASPGEICCYKLYHPASDPGDTVRKMLDQKIRFVPRGAIERAESFGADKMAK